MVSPLDSKGQLCVCVCTETLDISLPLCCGGPCTV
uniref:Uncharacterized protein n=1 Tax=Anguilla anguilla TaxID=7936 RepID=A0A0E9R9D9_ANGAN